jgi:dihydroceramide fatty acyl 2-hydroxylase
VEAGPARGRSARAQALAASPPIFESRALDRLTRVRPFVPVLIFLPAVAAFAVLGVRDIGLLDGVIAFASGYVIWTFSEYWIHRAVFHFEPANGLGARFHWMIHGVHHDHPDDPNRLVMPPAVSVPLGTVFFFAFAAAFGLRVGWMIASGFFAGYLFYDMLHYVLHHRAAKSALGKRLRELHMRHHFEDDRCGFAISAPWWDVLFGTYSPRAKRARAE